MKDQPRMLQLLPHVVVNEPVTPVHKIAEWGVAIHWLGDRYLLAQPVNRKRK